MYIFFFICILKVASTNILIDTKNGPIQGVASLADNVEAYLGIPYAEPPVGELRFAKPVPKTKWTEIYNASSFSPPCTQINIRTYYFTPDTTNMSEDCLYLNIWAPKTESTRGLKPVIVYIHPGAFMTGSSNIKAHDGSHLASRGDLVVVTINYRLGALGYFLAYIEEADGNMGMFDQIMAIKWVKDNAKYFGGDPENIVLMGASAGAFSVSAHMISPLSKNLFNRAILHSGSVVHPSLLDDNARLYRSSQQVASLVGCSNDTVNLKSDPQYVVKCLKLKPKEEFVKAEKILSLTNPLLFHPRVNDQFLPNSSVNLIREGKFRKDVDVLIGITKDEGTIMLMVALPEYVGYYGENEQILNKFRAFALSRSVVSLVGQSNASEIINYYMNNVKNRTTTGYLKMVSNVIGDFVVACSTIFFADLVSLKGNPVYFYQFEFRPASTPTAEWIGSTHLDEVQYVFGNPYHENFTAEETELSHRLIDRWSAFARTGNPNIPEHMPWLRYTYHNPLYLNFGQEEESIRRRPNDRCEVWCKRYNAEIDTGLIQSLRNSGMNIANTTVA